LLLILQKKKEKKMVGIDNTASNVQALVQPAEHVGM
jgi:hypothetical protein